MTRKTLRTAGVTLVACLLTLAATAAADTPYLMALQLDALEHTTKGKAHAAQGMARLVDTELIPQLEGLGFVVERVHDARKAIKDGDYHVAVRLEVDARPTWLVHGALQYDKTIVPDAVEGREVWGQYVVWSVLNEKHFAREIGHGKLGPLESRMISGGAGRPDLDDAGSVARQFADGTVQVIDAALKGAAAP